MEEEKERDLTKEEIENFDKNKKDGKFLGKFINKRGDRKIVVKEHTLWTKIEVSILAYFIKNNNKSATYRKITRAYIKSNYSYFQKACKDLVKKGKLENLENGSFKIKDNKLEEIKKGKEIVERAIPFLNFYVKKCKKS